MRVAVPAPMRLVFPLVTLGLLLGCGNPHDALLARLSACELVSDGEAGDQLLYSVYAPNQCYVDCLVAAPCDALGQALFCRTNLELLVACDQRCAFQCGDGTVVAVEQHCDGVTQCGNGFDEADCPAGDFTCPGTSMTARRCDGIYTCPGNEDEYGCYETCDGGAILYDWYRCDGNPNCGDGADELGCLEYVCADGRRLTYRDGNSPRCNGWSQCGDGSDEAGCAHLTVTCE